MKNFNTMADENYNDNTSNLAAVTGAPATGAAAAAAAATTAADHQQQQQQQLAGQVNAQQQANYQDQPSRRMLDEMSQDLQYLSREAPLDGGESTFGAYSTAGGGPGSQRDGGSMLRVATSDERLHYNNSNNAADADDDDYESSQRLATSSPYDHEFSQQHVEHLAQDNVDIQRPLQQAGFLVSFMVDARGGAMRGCRHSGVRVIIPPNTAQMPTRITCRYLRRERLVHPPPLMEGEACASKIMEVGPAGAKFLGPVLIEVPHFASLRGKEREIIILRSDTGEVWREHVVDADDKLVESIVASAEQAELEQRKQTNSNIDNNSDNVETTAALSDQENVLPTGSGASANKQQRLTRIVTTEFPQYFAIISRVRQEVHLVGPEGALVDSQVVPRVQATFTEGALTKRIKIGLQPNKAKNKSSQLDASQDATTEIEIVDETTTTTGGSRAQSPSGQSATGADTNRPQSSASQQSTGTKRRSKLLACFGTGTKHTNNIGDNNNLSSSDSNNDQSSAGGDSPKHISRATGHTTGVTCSSSASAVSSDANSDDLRSSPSLKRNKRTIVSSDELQLVPEDYYIEREPVFILNDQPKTYGKRMASSSAQTDLKLQANGILSTSARKDKKRRGLLMGKRRAKTQMTIHLDEVVSPVDSKRQRSKSNEPIELVDGDKSMQQLAEGENVAQQQPVDDILSSSSSIIHDVVTSDDHKWRTCIIQTDSDSVTVNYVTIHPDQGGAAAAAAVAAAATATNGSKSVGTTTGQDDGYVSGSGELKKGAPESRVKGVGLFSPFCASIEKDDEFDERLESKENQLASAGESQKLRKQRANAAKKAAKKQKNKADKQKAASEKSKAKHKETDKSLASVDLPTSKSGDEIVTIEGEIGADVSLDNIGQQQQQQPESLTTTITSSTSTSSATATDQHTRSVSPITSASDKESRQKLKLERQELARMNKLDKQKQKELDKQATRAQKRAEKQVKEAKKKAQEAQKAAEVAKKAAATAVSRSQSPIAIVSTGQQQQQQQQQQQSTSGSQPAGGGVASAQKLAQSVKFAPTLVETSQDVQLQQQSAPAQSEIGELQEHGHDMVRLSIGEHSQVSADVAPPPPAYEFDDSGINSEPQTQQLISFASSDSEQTPAPPVDASQRPLKPILKQQQQQQQQQSSSFDTPPPSEGENLREPESSLEGVASRLVSEATEEAVRGIDDDGQRKLSPLHAGGESVASESVAATTTSESKKEAAKRVKEEKERAKREKKAALEEAKRLANEAREAKKLAEAEAKRVAKEAKVEAERLAKQKKLEASEEKKKQKKEKEQEKKKNEEKDSDKSDVAPSGVDDEPGEQQIGDKPGESAALAGGGEKVRKKRKTDDGETVTSSVCSLIGSNNGDKHITSSPTTTSDATTSKSSFLSKLFGRKPRQTTKATTEPIVVSSTLVATADSKPLSDYSDEQRPPVEQQQQHHHHQSQGQMIISEMYPSDPNDADGEMILEVNVPQELIEPKTHVGQQQSTAQDTKASDQVAATATATTTATSLLDQDDQEATLVNISQMGDDEEATEDVVSQANEMVDLGQQSAANTADGASMSPMSIKSDNNEQQQGQPIGAEQQAPIVDDQKLDSTTTGVPLVSTSDGKSVDLGDETKRRELEAKLEREAKKCAKEEEKLRKKREKEEKLKAKAESKRAAAEAKQLAKEEREKVKREAKEAKRLAELAKKQSKLEKKQGKKEPPIGATVCAVEVEGEGEGEQSVAATSQQQQQQQQLTGSTVVVGDNGEQIDLSQMSPVNEETEVERIVEETTGADGTVTKTTKVIETKYVTMRQEEIKSAERRDIPIDEWQQQQQQQQQQIDAEQSDTIARRRTSTSSSNDSQQRPIEVTHVKMIMKPIESDSKHVELDTLQATPSYFNMDTLPEEIKPELPIKKQMKKRIKLNQQLIKRAKKLAKSEAKKAKLDAKKAIGEIVTCDEAAKGAQKYLKRALKESKRANKVAIKMHKNMDKIDKKLEKQAKKLEKRQRKLDKRAAKLSKKAAKKAAKQLEKQQKGKKGGETSELDAGLQQQVLAATASKRLSSASRSSGSKKSIKIEDIGAPVLHSSSRNVSLINNEQNQQFAEQIPVAVDNITNGGQQQLDADIHVDLTLDELEADHQHQQHQQPSEEQQANRMQAELEVARDEEQQFEIDVVGLDENTDIQTQQQQHVAEPLTNGSQRRGSSVSSSLSANSTRDEQEKTRVAMAGQ